MKKVLALVLCLCMVMPFAIGVASAEETITLRFSWWGDDARLAATLAVIEQFEELHPNIKIEAEYGSSDGYNDKLATQLSGGTAPDIIQIDPAFMPSYVSDETNYFVDLYTTDFDFSNFDPAYYQLRINGYFDGAQYGIPTGVSGGAMVVNADMAEKFGIDFSEQYYWEDMFTWAKQVHEADPEVYLLCSNKTFIANMASAYIKQKTGKLFIDEETKTVNTTVEELTDMFEFVKRMFDEYVVAPASYFAAFEGNNLQNDPNWIAGDKYVAAMVYTSTAEVVAAANSEVSYYAGKFPLLEGSDIDAHNANTPQVIAVNSKSAHIEEAVMFLNYFFNDETAMETLGTVRSVPPTARAREICAEKGLISTLLAQACDVATSYSGMVDDSYFSSSEAKQIFYDEIEMVGYGAATPAEAGQEMYDMLSDYMSTK